MRGEPQPRVQWQSVRWPDNSTFEGLVRGDKCHVRGVFKYSNGDRYEGEFEDNDMSGYGVYVWGQEGSVYRGQWVGSMMNGCGVKITKQPSGGYLAEEGQFVNDEWVGDVMGCSIEQARAAAAEADTAAQMARVFELGDGAVTEADLRAQQAAATAASTAHAAKSRRLQRQQQQQQQRPSADVSRASAAEAEQLPVRAAAAPFRALPQLQDRSRALLRQAQQGAEGVGQAAQRAATQATRGVQQGSAAAGQAVQRLLNAGQLRVQRLQQAARDAGAGRRA